MGFDVVIHSPAAILIIAGVLFLAFNDSVPGWILVSMGFVLALFITHITAKKKGK